MKGPDQYELLNTKAKEIESELLRLKRWSDQPLPQEKFDNMGAFGSNTMAFEQWLQFVLIPRLYQITANKGELPTESMVSTYAVRALDGDPEAINLISLLSRLDDIINAVPNDTPEQEFSNMQYPMHVVNTDDTITLGDETVPLVVYTLAEVLPQFEGDDLESQLQAFDIFLGILSPTTRPIIAGMLQKAATQATSAVARERIEQAARAVAEGGNASAT